jgi:uncharacterized protein (TIGR02001 family)
MKKTLIAITVAGVAAMAVPAVAQAELSANVAVTSKYKFRGQDQSSDPEKAVLPALQGGFDYAAGGFYVGNWNSSIGWADTDIEMDFYGGYSGEAGGISYDVGVLTYYYPNTDLGLNTTEVYGSVGFGPLTAKYSHTVSSKWFGVEEGRNSGYLELNGEMEVASGITLIGHIGTTRFSSDAKDTGAVVNYSDYKVGAAFDLGNGFSAEAAYVGANKKSFYGDLNKARVIFTLSKSL